MGRAAVQFFKFLTGQSNIDSILNHCVREVFAPLVATKRLSTSGGSYNSVSEQLGFRLQSAP